MEWDFEMVVFIVGWSLYWV